MKNLKKVLALVLVVAMMMTFAVSASAATYEDADQITDKYAEAVDVMSAVGVFEGTNGNLNPQGNLTREQAAKIISYLLLGKDAADKLSVSASNFSDVEVGRWSAGYIEFCYSKGIVSGHAGKFNPKGTLKGTEFAKMLLVALGYDASAESMIGASWEINTSNLAVEAGIDNGFALSEVITREQAVQMAFSTLKATCVKYTGGTNITIGDTTISQGATRQVVVSADAYASQIVAGGDVTVNGVTGKTVQLGEKLYKGKLVYAPAGVNGVDTYGRAANTWTYNNVPVGTYATAVATYTATVSNASAFSAATNVDTKALNAGLNAVLGISANNLKVSGADEQEVYINGKVTSDAATVTLNAGDKVEVFTAVGNSRDVTKVVVIRQSYGKILNVTANTGKAKANKTDANGDPMVYNYKITIDTDGDTSANITTNDLDLAGYTDEYVKGAYLNLVMKDAAVLDSTIAKTEEGAITTFANGASVTVNGTKRFMANATIPGYNTSVDFKTGKYVLVLNDAGYVTCVETVSAAAATLDDVVFTSGKTWTETSTKYGVTTTTVYMQMIAMDGTIEDVVVGAYKSEPKANAEYTKITELVDGADVISVTEKGDSANDIVSVTTKAENLYNTTNVPASAGKPAYTRVSTFKVAGYTATKDNDTDGFAFTNKTTKYESKYIGSDTKFLLINGTGANVKTATYTGSISYTTGADDVAYYIYNIAGALVQIVLPGSSMTMSDSTVVYVAAATTDMNGSSTYLQANVYDAEGNKLDAISIKAEDKNLTGFVTYTVTDGVYDLTELTGSAATFVDKDTDWTANVGAKYYEDVKFVKNFYENYASFTDASHTLFDIPAASVKVVDLRAPNEMAYNAELTSLDDIITADSTIKTDDTTYDVTASVVLNASGVATIFVTAVG